ncbi:MAG: cation diffusion facilitator family transporter [Candidatus Contendobacter sp.]
MFGSSGNASKEEAARTAVIAGAIDVLVTLSALIAAHSSVLLADFFKTSLEFVAVLLSWLAIRRIVGGSNHQFDYGIGKLENLSSLFVGSIMLLGMLVIVINAIANIFNPSHIEGIGVWISLVAQIVFGVINGTLSWRSFQTARAENSPLMKSQAQLFFTRAFGNVFILLALGLSLLLSGFSWSIYIDPAASLVIAASILISAIGVLSSSFYDLLDRTLEEADQIVILRELAQHFHDYEALHGIRSRRAGGEVFVEVFLEFDPDKTMGEIQTVADALCRSIEAQIPSSRVAVALAKDALH